MIEQLIESLRIEETKDHIIVYDLEPHMLRLFNSIQTLNLYLPTSLRKTKQSSQMQEFSLLLQTQIKAKTQYQFNKGVAFFDSRFNIENDSISLRKRGPGSQIYKLRLIYCKDGSFTINIEKYLRDLNKEWQVKVLGPEGFQINSTDPKWRHKFYPRPSLRGTKQSSPPDELIWTNEKKQICEGSFTNIFFQDQESQWHTPHLECNILPGITRAKLIKELNAKEGFYTELPTKVLLVNSMFCKLVSIG